MSENRATKIGHWPSGPVPVCEDHARQLKALGDVMGVMVVFSAIPANETWPTLCKNCINEKKFSA